MGLQVLLGVSGLQWSVPTKSSPSKGNWSTDDRAMGTQGSWGARANPGRQPHCCSINCWKSWCWKGVRTHTSHNEGCSVGWNVQHNCSVTLSVTLWTTLWPKISGSSVTKRSAKQQHISFTTGDVLDHREQKKDRVYGSRPGWENKGVFSALQKKKRQNVLCTNQGGNTSTHLNISNSDLCCDTEGVYGQI